MYVYMSAAVCNYSSQFVNVADNVNECTSL